MEHTSTENLSKEEIRYNELIQRGEDFMKIEIFRNAREYFEMALASNYNNMLSQQKLDDCNKKIKKESKTIIRLLVVTGFIIAAAIVYFQLS